MQQIPMQSVSIHPIQRLRGLLLDYDFEFSELFGGVVAFSWGFWLLLPWPTFAKSPTFAAMQELAPEWVWGLFICSLGATQLASLIASWWQWRRRSALGMCLVWVFISVMFWRANFSSTASVVYPFIALSQLWAYLRMRFTYDQP